MIGQKLHELLKELDLNERKNLLSYCSYSSDKRLTILRSLINANNDSIESINHLLSEKISVLWPNLSLHQHDLKMRRFANYFCDEIENVLLANYLEKNRSIRQLLLAEAKVAKGNLNLLNNYYNKAYLKSEEEENLVYKLLSLKGKIRMGYAAQSEKN